MQIWEIKSWDDSAQAEAVRDKIKIAGHIAMERDLKNLTVTLLTALQASYKKHLFATQVADNIARYLGDALISAAAAGNNEIIDIILSLGFSPHYSTSTKDAYALQSAAVHNHADTIEHLVSLGANLEHKDKKFGYTPLFYAARKGALQAVQTLLRLGANAESTTYMGMTPLMLAASEGHLEIVRLLLSRVSREHASKANRSNYTALYSACLGGHTEVASELLNHGVDINAYFPLDAAVKSGNPATIKMMIDRGADVTARREFGETIFHTAASYNAVDIMPILEPYCDIRAVNSAGETPLIIAALRGNLEAVQYLIHRLDVADINHATSRRATALSVAEKYNYSDVADLLRQAGAQ